MDPAEELVRASYVFHLLQAGGAYAAGILMLGGALAFWGAVNLLFVRSRPVLHLHLVMSLLPAIIGVVGVIGAYRDFSAMTASPTAPDPVEFARVVSFAMACGVWGPLATLLPATLGLIALMRPPAEPLVDSTDR